MLRTSKEYADHRLWMWAMWAEKKGASGLGYQASSLNERVGGSSGQSRLPMDFDPMANEVEDVVMALSKRADLRYLFETIMVHYRQGSGWTDRQRAAALGIGEQAYRNRKNRAWEVIYDALNDLGLPEPRRSCSEKVLAQDYRFPVRFC